MTQQAAQNDFSAQDAVEFTESLSGLLRSGGTLGQALEITGDECEALYQLGHGFYEQGRYSEAFQTFSLLVIYDHLEARYVMGLAGAAQMLGRHTDALQHYATAAMIRLDDPLPMFHAAECLIALQRLPEAIDSLELAAELANEKHPVVAARANALLAVVKERLQ